MDFNGHQNQTNLSSPKFLHIGSNVLTTVDFSDHVLITRVNQKTEIQITILQ